MKILQSIATTLTVLLAVGATAQAAEEKKETKSPASSTKEDKIEIKTQPDPDAKSPICENGGGGAIG
jgi:hypothetical protein